MKKTFGFVLLWVSFLSVGWAADGKARVMIEDMLSLKIPSAPTLSPDGKRVAFVLTEADFQESKYRTHIEVVFTETGVSRRFTNSPEGETAPHWSPDGQWLAFASQRKTKANKKEKRKEDEEEEATGESGKSQVWIMPADGGEAQKLTNAPEGVTSYEWMPDGKSIVYLAKESHPKPVKEVKGKEKKSKIDGVVEDEEKFRKQFWMASLDTKKERRILDGDLGIAEFSISPDGTKIAYATNYTGKEDDDKKFDIWAFAIVDGKPWPVTQRPGGERTPRWSPDGRTIAFVSPVDPELTYSQNDLFLVGAQGGEPRNLTRDFDQAILSFLWPAGGGAIYFTADARAHQHLYRLDLATARIAPVTQGDRVVNGFDVSRDGRTLAWSMEDAVSAPDIWRQVAEQSPRALTRLNPQVAALELGAQEVVRWKGAEGWEIEGILVKPVGYRPGRKYPTLIAIHGGPYGRTLNTLRQYNQFQVWAANGYAVLAPNYRGSAGYGNRFGIANRGDLGGKDYRDIMAGVDALIRLGIADPDRLGVFGGSYGGYMTNWIITQTPRFKAAISMFGIFNLITDFSNSTMPSWETDYLTKYYWDHMEDYLKRSPFYYVKNIQTPVLIIHGEADTNTYISNSKELYQALRTLKKPVEFVHYPREGHGLREPNHRIDEMRRCLQWFDRYLKGDSPEAATAFGLKQPVRHGAWELTVLSATPGGEYLGRAAEENETYMEVLFTLQHKADTPEPLTIRLSMSGASDLLLSDRQGRSYLPAGVPTEVLGERLLISGTDQTVTITPDKESKSTTVPLLVTFQVPKAAREFLFKVKDFPSVNFYAKPAAHSE